MSPGLFLSSASAAASVPSHGPPMSYTLRRATAMSYRAGRNCLASCSKEGKAGRDARGASTRRGKTRLTAHCMSSYWSGSARGLSFERGRAADLLHDLLVLSACEPARAKAGKGDQRGGGHRRLWASARAPPQPPLRQPRGGGALLSGPSGGPEQARGGPLLGGGGGRMGCRVRAGAL